MSFLHESCCSRQFVKIPPSLIYIHMKNDLAVMGGNEAVRVAIISTLSGHVPQETAYSQCRSSFEDLVSVATQCASLFHFGCENQRQEVEMIPHSQLKKKKKNLLWFSSRFKHLLRVQPHLEQAHNKLESQWYHWYLPKDRAELCFTQANNKGSVLLVSASTSSYTWKQDNEVETWHTSLSKNHLIACGPNWES